MPETDLKALGVHVFAGGFTIGVQRVMEVIGHLETHGFGLSTARSLGVEVQNSPPEDWPRLNCQLIYGNPRCTGFSCVTGGYDDSTHGPWSRQTLDIHQLTDYAIECGADCIVWESVQQAFSGAGKELVKWLVQEKYAPAGYRVAHLLLNTATWGNCQIRKRYFFVAYRGDKAFNITPPDVTDRIGCVYDALWDLRNLDTTEMPHPSEYGPDSYVKLTPNEKACVPNLPNGWNLNMLARHFTDALPDSMKVKWNYRSSEMPFSLHCIMRLQWTRPMPTIHSSAARWIHPWYHRPLTVRELATAMGWGDVIPSGKAPIAQIAKGIVPDVGEWLARQVVSYLADEWGDEDWESSYNWRTGIWEGRDTHGEVEKTFDLTNYTGREIELEDLDYDARIPRHLRHVEKRRRGSSRPA